MLLIVLQVPTKKSDLMYPTLLVSVRLLVLKLSQIKKIVSVEGEVFKRQATMTTITTRVTMTTIKTMTTITTTTTTTTTTITITTITTTKQQGQQRQQQQ